MLHCVPLPDAGAPAMIILGALFVPAPSITIPLLMVVAAARAGEDANHPCSGCLLLTDDVCEISLDNERDWIHESVRMLLMPNQLRLRGFVAGLAMGDTNAGVVAATPAGADAAVDADAPEREAVAKHIARVVRAAESMQIRRRT